MYSCSECVLSHQLSQLNIATFIVEIVRSISYRSLMWGLLKMPSCTGLNA